MDRAINPESYMNEVVYDLDQMSVGTSTDATAQKRYNIKISKIVY